jgi:hypothetical protein
MVWNHFTDYLKGSLNSLGRALNIHGGRSLEDPAVLERWKAELATAISVRQMDPSALVSLGRRGFNSEFRFWVLYKSYAVQFFNILGMETHFKWERYNRTRIR